MTNPNFQKDPQAELDYSIDWSGWLAAGETISVSTWTLPTGLTAPRAATFTGEITTVWLAGGTANVEYSVVNRITTTALRLEERTLFITVRQR